MADLERDNYVYPGTRLSRDGLPIGVGQGISVRDWFAGQALQGILAGGFADTVPHDAVDNEASFYAYKYADEMLAQREK